MTDLRARPLVESDLGGDPLAAFHRWFGEARAAGCYADVMALATAEAGGAPSVRFVLLKDAAGDGLTFYSSYESRKGRELAENPHAALAFYWEPLGRQVRVEGPIERASAADADAYWQTRPLGSRLSAAVSSQSEVVESRELLEDARAVLGDDPPRPPSWGGFRLRPEGWEFWQHRDDRLHDRFRYRLSDGGWIVERLAP